MIERIINSPHPTVGVVIGTYGAVPYIHLQLESWRRNYGNIPLLVHDDCSPEGDALRDLCTQYGADFSCNEQPYGHFAGDLTAFSHGLRWAEGHSLDLLVKFSRRFIPLISWVQGLQILAYVSQYASYSNVCRHFDFGFRTECLALHVPSWMAADMASQFDRHARERQMQDCFVEVLVHDFARHVHQHNCLFNKLYETVHRPPDGAEGYAPWGLLGTSRKQRLSHALWHNIYDPFEYYLAAVSYGILDYDASRFESIHV